MENGGPTACAARRPQLGKHRRRWSPPSRARHLDALTGFLTSKPQTTGPPARVGNGSLQPRMILHDKGAVKRRVAKAGKPAPFSHPRGPAQSARTERPDNPRFAVDKQYPDTGRPARVRSSLFYLSSSAPGGPHALPSSSHYTQAGTIPLWNAMPGSDIVLPHRSHGTGLFPIGASRAAFGAALRCRSVPLVTWSREEICAIFCGWVSSAWWPAPR